MSFRPQIATGATISLLASLRVLSPEFSPSWRVVSEHAFGRYGCVLSLMFLSWGISSSQILLIALIFLRLDLAPSSFAVYWAIFVFPMGAGAAPMDPALIAKGSKEMHTAWRSETRTAEASRCRF